MISFCCYCCSFIELFQLYKLRWLFKSSKLKHLISKAEKNVQMNFMQKVEKLHPFLWVAFSGRFRRFRVRFKIQSPETIYGNCIYCCCLFHASMHNIWRKVAEKRRKLWMRYNVHALQNHEDWIGSDLNPKYANYTYSFAVNSELATDYELTM